MRVIRKYPYRKMYDTSIKRYVTLVEIGEMIKNDEEISIIAVDTNKDVTAATLTQLIFETERNSSKFASISILREIIQSGKGTMSDYIDKFTY